MNEGLSPASRQGIARVLIVDDHPVVRQGLAQLIGQEEDMTVCGEADNVQSALETIDKERPDVAIVDIVLKDASGIDLIKDLRLRRPDLPVLVLSMHDESVYAERVLRAGAKGYIMKQEAAEEVVNAVRRVLSGGIYLSEKMTDHILGHMLTGKEAGCSPIDRLSDRELEVFHLVGRGLATRQIAERLNLSIKTIETYREHMKQKLDLKGASELLQYAIQWVRGRNPT